MRRSVRTRFSLGMLAFVLAAAFFAGGTATAGWQHTDACDTGPTNSC